MTRNLGEPPGSADLPVAAAANARSLDREIAWLTKVLETRISSYFEQPNPVDSIAEVAPPDLTDDDSPYAELVRRYEMNFDERVVLVLALTPQVRPQALEMLFIRNTNVDRGFAEFGGRSGGSHGGFLPTLETAAFLLSGQDLERRFESLRMFDRDHFFIRNGILRITPPGQGEPYFSAALSLSSETLNLITAGITQRPDYSIDFPAKLTTTKLRWEDLVLAPEVMDEIASVTAWVEHAETIMDDWGLGRALKPGYRCLFYGPPGTGKTLTATLIGAAVGADVYRIDLSMIVSKYIGETEKNLANVFDQAENKNWILFFDEADALFGRRTQTSNSNDRHANQEISYLLQRVEDFPGLVILATNLKANIDEAFARRFQSVIYFPMPDAELRLRLWKGVLGDGVGLDDDVDLMSLAEDHILSGGAILNVVRYSAIVALQEERNSIREADLLEGVRKEFRKEGRTL